MQRHQTNTAVNLPSYSPIAKTDYKAAIYCRLSKDDGKATESSSIQTQRDMLTRYIREQGWNVSDYYVDAGYSGLTFERPEFKRMIADIEDGKVDLVITKDLSRLGRNYLETGVFIEVFFPERGVRYIALNDGVDTLNNANTDITPFKNILNEMYAKDLSRKVKSAKRARFAEGQFLCTSAPFGYRKDPNDHHKLVIDEPAAAVVRKIFALALSGMGISRIRKVMTEEGVVRPGAYQKGDGGNYDRYFIGNEENRTFWSNNSVRGILRSPVYAGHIAGYKRPIPSMKSRKRLSAKPEDWAVVRNTHEPIIDQESFDLVQKLITSRRRNETKWGENIFAGLLKCADCGYIMRRSHAHRGMKEDFLANLGFTCNRYSLFGKEQCTQHWLEARPLYDAVLADIRLHAKLALKNGDAFARQIMERKKSQQKADSVEQSRELKKAKARLSELDGLFQKLYEDRASGAIGERNYRLLSGKYEEEQQALEKRISSAEQSIKNVEQAVRDVRSWVNAIQQYIDTMELTAPMLHELIEKITVGERKMENGEQTQAITIYYKFVGNIS
jgi:DNA invertase Pin-like site-specific DNA recombinase